MMVNIKITDLNQCEVSSDTSTFTGDFNKRRHNQLGQTRHRGEAWTYACHLSVKVIMMLEAL